MSKLFILYFYNNSEYKKDIIKTILNNLIIIQKGENLKYTEIYSKVDEWLDRIHREKLYISLNSKTIEKDNSIEVNAYNYLKREDQWVFIEINNEMYYIKIYNNYFLKNIEDPNQHNTYYPASKQNIKTKATRLAKNEKYKFVKKSKVKDSESIKIDLFENVFLQKTKNIKTQQNIGIRKKHLNDVWSIKASSDIFTTGLIETLDKYQKQAYDEFTNNSISIITGYAGSGKSYLIKHISNKLRMEGWLVSRLAPTGKAAQVILGKTIHSWLEPIIEAKSQWNYEIVGFRKDKIKEKECLIVDECSMIDNEIWSEIKRVWQNSKKIENKKVIFVGDPAQLEPVGYGSPFIDMIGSKKYPHYNLMIIHRTGNSEMLSIDDMSLFVRNNGYIDNKNNYKGVKRITIKEAFEMIIKDNSCIMITPNRNGPNGTLIINNQIKKHFNLDDEKESFHSQVWNQEQSQYIDHAKIHLNDKIIIIKNLWEWNITNGTSGIYLGEEKLKLYNHIKKKYSSLRNCYKFKSVNSDSIFYLPANKFTRVAIELAYAITIHKSQGSEYNNVILYVTTSWINKKMLYTAVTRAKQNLYIVINKIVK